MNNLMRAFIAVLLLSGATLAQAAGTTAGTDVNNQATVSFSTGGVPQTPVTSNTTTFKVDRKVDLTVVELGTAATVVSPGQVDQATEFTVTNLSNATMDLALAVAQDPSATVTAHGNADSFDVTNVRIYRETDGVIGYSAGDALVTYLDELLADESETVYVVADIPANVTNGQAAGVSLIATASEAGTVGVLGAVTVETAGADNPGVVDTVLADGAGDVDAARDGKFSDDDDYVVQSATLSVVKSSRTVSDPFNGTTDPKAIPGAVVQYCIEVSNSGAVPATTVNVTDNISGQPVTFVSGSITTGATSCVAGDGVAEDDDAIGLDELPDGGSFTAGTVSGSFSTIATGTTARLIFDVTIN